LGFSYETRGLYLDVTGFESWPEHWLSWFRLLMVVFSPSKAISR